jgi:hypothetical protein
MVKCEGGNEQEEIKNRGRKKKSTQAASRTPKEGERVRKRGGFDHGYALPFSAGAITTKKFG